jgi:predicted glycosyltransferase
MVSDDKKKIWIDLDNSPHVPFFKPIIDELSARGFELSITARDCFQVCGLADMMNLHYKKIGRHYGKNIILKIVGLLIRSAQLLPSVLYDRPHMALSHGSRAQVFLSSILRIPSIVIVDYEFTQAVAKPDYVIVPELIPDSAFKHLKSKVLKYPGIKEDVYVPFFKPDSSILNRLGIREDVLLITIRPPATEAHYHNPESEKLFYEVVEFIGRAPNTCMVILPRNEKKQTAWIKNTWSEWCDTGKIIIPEHVVNGLDLMWFSDLVVSGGGTMNREAAALGVPVYSIFRGKIGAVDRYLSDNGRLILLESVEDVKTKVKIVSRDKSINIEQHDRNALNTIVKHIIDILEK